MNWFKKPTKSIGSALFAGATPPRAHEFDQLQGAGFTVRDGKPRDGAHWALSLDHPAHGPAEVFCLKDPVPVPRTIVRFDRVLTDEDRDRICDARSEVALEMPGKGRGVFREHKSFLRVLRLLMGDDGIAAADAKAQKFWTRQALDDELAHDADVDIESLFTLHAVYDPDERAQSDGTGAGNDDTRPRTYWLHSHGLAELGFVDFDVLEPSEDFINASSDPTRAIALAIVEGRLAASGTPLPLCHPGGAVEAVDAATFDHSADHRFVSLRDAEGHTDRRVVLCEPRGGWLSRLFSREPDDREHMWFEVHDAGEREIDATLMNEPFQIARMQAGQRGKHPVDLLTEWAIMTPFGPINLRQTVALRMVRSDPDAVRRMMEEHRGGQEER